MSGVWDEATKILGYLGDAAADASVDLPTRQYCHAGEVAYDCEQATVAFRLLQLGLPASLQTDPAATGEYGWCAPVWSIIMDVAIVRCGAPLPDSGIPLAADLAAASEIQAADASVLMDAASRRADEKWGAVVASTAFATPAGGLVATIMTMTCAVST